MVFVQIFLWDDEGQSVNGEGGIVDGKEWLYLGCFSIVILVDCAGEETNKLFLNGLHTNLNKA